MEGPWSVVAADIMGPLAPSKGGCRYMIVFEDLFTKYVEIKPLRKADAKNILKAFDELVVHRWACPQYLLTDNGTEFVNKMITEPLNQYGIIQTTIPPYPGQSGRTREPHPEEHDIGVLKERSEGLGSSFVRVLFCTE